VVKVVGRNQIWICDEVQSLGTSILVDPFVTFDARDLRVNCPVFRGVRHRGAEGGLRQLHPGGHDHHADGGEPAQAGPCEQ